MKKKLRRKSLLQHKNPVFFQMYIPFYIVGDKIQRLEKCKQYYMELEKLRDLLTSMSFIHLKKENYRSIRNADKY